MFVASSLTRELEFRANFLAKVLHNCVWILFFVVMILVIYRNTDDVAGWSRGDALVLVGTCMGLSAITSGFFIALHEVPEQVRKGTLDFVLTKPVDSQAWVSLRKFQFDHVGTLLAAGATVAIGLAQAGSSPDAQQWTGYGLMAFCALAIVYAFNVAITTLGIWFVRVENLWVLGETAMDVARYPIDIYGARIQRFLTFVFPLALIGSLPTKQLVHGFDGRMVAVSATYAVVSLIGTRYLWKFALRFYTSASS